MQEGKTMMINGLFDADNRLKELSKSGDPLERINKTVDWEIFRPRLEVIHEKERKSNAGRKAYNVVLMFKILILQSLYNVSDDSLEYQIKDRLSFMRFLGLELADDVPDAKTIWLFREQLKSAGLVKELFKEFDRYLTRQGFNARKGQIIDATIVSVPMQRNSREENQQIKNGDVPKDWSQEKQRQKDTEARWVTKYGADEFGYKNNVNVDAGYKLIRQYTVTDAATHDSQMFGELLDDDNSSADVWADSAYYSKDTLALLEEQGYREHINRKGFRYKPLSECQRRANRRRSKIRCRIEHVFGMQTKITKDTIIRTVGRLRVAVKIGLRNIAYNIWRMTAILRIAAG
jgi:IS5 family transposase